MTASGLLQSGFYASLVAIVGYCAFVSVLALPAVQNQVIYLNRVTLTWF